MKRVLTYTMIAGNRSCPNDCPICISKMTSSNGIGYDPIDIDLEKFKEATDIAVSYGARNALITSKGEATIYPQHITDYLSTLYDKSFERMELQTEGSILALNPKYYKLLDEWKGLGLDLIALSVYHYDDRKNSEMFSPKSGCEYNIRGLIDRLHSKGYMVRLSCVMLKDYIDSVEEVKNLIEFARKNDVEQLTLRRADRPKEPLDMEVALFVDENRLTDDEVENINLYLENNGVEIEKLPHGAVVYDIDGQNVCMTTGLTDDTGKEEVRQLIYFPQGILTSSWEDVEGGRIL